MNWKDIIRIFSLSLGTTICWDWISQMKYVNFGSNTTIIIHRMNPWSCLDKTQKDWPIFKINSFLSIYEPGLYVVPKWQRWHPLVSSMTGDMGDIRMVTWGGVRSVTMEMEADAPCPTLLRATQLYSPGPVTLMFLGKRKMFLLLINFMLLKTCSV